MAFKWGPEAELKRRERVLAARKREWMAMWPEERSAKARKAINTRWEALRARFGYNPRPYIPLGMRKKPKKGESE
jgi:hypothetical protein